MQEGQGSVNKQLASDLHSTVDALLMRFMMRCHDTGEMEPFACTCMSFSAFIHFHSSVCLFIHLTHFHWSDSFEERASLLSRFEFIFALGTHLKVGSSILFSFGAVKTSPMSSRGDRFLRRRSVRSCARAGWRECRFFDILI